MTSLTQSIATAEHAFNILFNGFLNCSKHKQQINLSIVRGGYLNI